MSMNGKMALSPTNFNALENENQSLKARMKVNEKIDRNAINEMIQHINYSLNKEREYREKIKVYYSSRYTNNDYYIYNALLDAQCNTTKILKTLQSSMEADFRRKY